MTSGLKGTLKLQADLHMFFAFFSQKDADSLVKIMDEKTSCAILNDGEAYAGHIYWKAPKRNLHNFHQVEFY